MKEINLQVIDSWEEGGERGEEGGEGQWDEEGKKILASLRLDPHKKKTYSHIDPLWKDPTSPFTIYVGDVEAAGSKQMLNRHNIKFVVNCTERLDNFFEDTEEFCYFRFLITNWRRESIHTNWFQDREFSSSRLRDFVVPLFNFLETIRQENALQPDYGNVLIHCLAGAHRAGTTACACLMFYEQLNGEKAIKMAKVARQQIDPFGFLLLFLKEFEKISHEVREEIIERKENNNFLEKKEVLGVLALIMALLPMVLLMAFLVNRG